MMLQPQMACHCEYIIPQRVFPLLHLSLSVQGSTWLCKPEPISATRCALNGWINTATDTLHCTVRLTFRAGKASKKCISYMPFAMRDTHLPQNLLKISYPADASHATFMQGCKAKLLFPLSAKLSLSDQKQVASHSDWHLTI